MDFSMRVFVFLISGLLKNDFSMRIFVFLASGIVVDGAVPVFSFEFILCLGPELFFQWKSLFFLVSRLLKIDFSMKVFVFLGPRPIENWFFNESVCFFGLSHCGRRCRACFFIWIYNVFKTRINFSMRVLFFWSQAYWKLIFQWEPLFFLVSGLLKIDFLMRLFVFLVSGLLKIDFSMRVFVFLVSGVLKFDFSMRIFVFLASGIVEDGAVPFFHVNLRCFWDPPCFSMKVFVFLFQAYWKWIFQWKYLFFWSKAYWKSIFQWKCLFFGLRHCGRRCCARFFIWTYSVFKTRIVFSVRVFVFLVSGLLKIDFSMRVFVFLVQALWKTVLCLFFFGTRFVFSMKLFVFWSEAYWKSNFQRKSLFFESQTYWKLIFQ